MTLLQDVPTDGTPTGRPTPQWRARVVAVCLGLVTLSFLQDPGRVAADTKLDLTVNPWGFLARALHLWDQEGFFGQLQNQAYGYLWPMGPFFGVGQAVGLPDWVVQRLWWSLVLVGAFLGMYLLLKALGVGSGWPQILAGLAYALAVRPQSALGAISVEVWPFAMAPWVLLPLVRGARRGSEVRAAALSALAVTSAGGVNAVAAGAVLPLAVWWLLTLQPGPRRRRLMGWWSGLTVLALLWWVLPLLVLGQYSPPFLDWIESAEFTTLITDPMTVMRGADHWIAYLGGASSWTAGWLLATEPVLVFATGLVAAGGMAGLAMRSLPHRGFLVGAAVAGLVLVSAGHIGPMSGLGSGLIQDFLDGAGAPLRNVHKFDLVLRLPLVIGFCHLLSAIWPRTAESSLPIQRRAQRWLCVTLVLALLVSWFPALTGQLTRDRSYPGLDDAWRESAIWLNEKAERGRALIVPGASFGDYVWGRPQDEPLQAFGGYPWGVRDAVPLSSAGNIRMLDAVESRLASGRGSPGLSSYLERMGVRYLVVRNDLAPAAGAPAAIRVHQALDASTGIRRVAFFGGIVSGDGGKPGVVTDEGVGAVGYPAIEIYEVSPSNDAPDPLAVLRPATDAVELQGAPEALLGLADVDALGNRPTFLAGDPAASGLAAAATFATDTDRRREITFGYIRDNESATMAASDDYVQSRPTHDFRVTPGAGQTVAAPSQLLFTASSSVPDVRSTRRQPRGATPEAAMDGALDTYWLPGDRLEERSFWEVRYPSPITLGDTLDLALVDDGTGARSVPLTIVTDAGTQRVDAAATPLWQKVAAPSGMTSRLRIELGEDGRTQRRGLREVRLPGEAVSTLVLPAAAEGAGVLLTSRPGDVSDCASREDLVVCADSLGGFSEDRTGLHRIVDLSSPLVTTPRLQVAVRQGAALEQALDDLSPTTVTASSRRSAGLRGRPKAAFDRDPGTAWQAAAGDADPWLEVRLSEPRQIRGIRVVNRTGLNASSPLELRVRAGGQQFNGFTDNRGLFRFGPITTDTLHVTFLATNVGRSRSAEGERILPVGVSEMAIVGADDLRQPLPPLAWVTLPCGTGPDVKVNGTTVLQTSVTARVEQFEADVLLPAEPCDPTVAIPEGRSDLSVVSTAAFQPITALFPPPGYLGPSGRPVSPEIRSWEPTHRILFVEPSGSPRVLEVAENYNRGWRASAADQELLPVRVDGWKQAFLVPAGVEADVTVVFAPDRPYRLGLLVGLLGVLAVGWVAARPPRLSHEAPTWPRPLPRLTATIIGVGLLLVFGPWGLALGAVGAVLLRGPLPVVALGGVAAASAVAAVAGVRPDPVMAMLQASPLVLAWAAVLRASWMQAGESASGQDAPPARN